MLQISSQVLINIYMKIDEMEFLLLPIEGHYQEIAYGSCAGRDEAT